MFADSLLIVSIFSGIGIMLLILAIFAKPKQALLDKEASNNEDWLYSNLLSKMYHIFFKDKDAAAVCKSLGLKLDTFLVQCAILRHEPDFETEAMRRILGIVCFFISIAAGLMLGVPLLMLVGVFAYYILSKFLESKIQSAAKFKKNTLMIEMSRFTGLLLTALEVGMPVDIAIKQTAENVPGVFSEELKMSFVEVNMGAKNWQKALEDIASMYEIDQLSDFVVDITTAFNKGVSVTEAVMRKADDIKKSSLLLAKERTAKMSSAILGPVTFFKIIPLMIIMMIPIVMQIMSM